MKNWKSKNNLIKSLIIILLIPILSCNFGISLNKESIINKKKGVLILIGNNHSSYADVFVPNKDITIDNLDIFFTDSKKVRAEEIWIDQTMRDELQIYYCRSYKNENTTSTFYGEFCAIPILIEYVRKIKKRYLSKQPWETGYDIEFQVKGFNTNKILKVDRIDEMRILDIEPIINKKELLEIRKKIRDNEEKYHQAIEPCRKKYFGIPDSISTRRFK